MDAGMTNYMPKPISFRALGELLQSVLKPTTRA